MGHVSLFRVSTTLKGHIMKKKITHLMLLFALTAFFVSCQSQPEQIPGYENLSLNPNFEADIQTVYSMITACLNGDINGMETYLHPDYKAYGPGYQEEKSRDEVIDRWASFARNFEDGKLENAIYYSLIISDDSELNELIGTWLMVWGNISFSDGQHRVYSPVHMTFRMKNGKIDTGHFYYDRLTRNQQFGLQDIPAD